MHLSLFIFNKSDFFFKSDSKTRIWMVCMDHGEKLQGSREGPKYKEILTDEYLP
jgi:hypothetical protein